MKEQDITYYLNGEALYGDDFPPEDIQSWFGDEREGYFQLVPRDPKTYKYEYHAINWIHGFSQLPDINFNHVLGIGAAYGDEFLPIISRINRIAILEPSQRFWSHRFENVPIEYVFPDPSGVLPFEDNSFDLLTCFGVLHHIPNVSLVMGEMARCLKPGGFALVREPIISMGDWRKDRKGLTKRERGIPLGIFRQIIASCGFKVCREALCMFSLTSRLNFLLRTPVYNLPFWTRIDALVCCLPIWSARYHPRFFFHKLRPWAVFYVLTRPAN